MATFRSDPLLAIARGILTFSMVVSIIVGSIVLAASPSALLFRERVAAELAKSAVAVSPVAFGVAVGTLLLLIAGMAALAYLFLRHMRRIVDSVGEGDPFAPVNGDRLRAMGWLTLAIQVIGIPCGALALWIGHVTEGEDMDFGISIGGLLLALVLFILARVFRRGAEMREELEGTV